MATSLNSLKSELTELTKNELIDLLLLPESQQKSEKLTNIKHLIAIKNTKASTESKIDKSQCLCRLEVEKFRTEIEDLKQVISSLKENTTHVQNDDGLDYAVGMAYSFFYGYLKLVIPSPYTGIKHLKELMQIYEDKEKVRFDFYKLFILLPKSLYCPASLVDVSNITLSSRSLEEKKIAVAGLPDRSYKNAVYKIQSGETFTYVVAEYATPMKTFKDVFTYYGEHSRVYKANKDLVVSRFYSTLKKILQENEDCTDYCELIFYDDKDDNGRNKDVGQILLQRIQQLRNEV